VTVNAFLGVSFFAFFFIIFAILVLPMVFFLLTQQRALTKCSPANRTMTPGLVWLQIIPFFGFIWQFFVVVALANSLGNEFAARRIPEEPKPGQSLGLAMCITRVCTVIPFLGIFAAIASLVLWIIYWVKIAGFSRKLDYLPAAPFLPSQHGAGYSSPAAIGGAPYVGGARQVAPPGAAQTPAPVAPPSAGELVAAPAAAGDCASCGAQLPEGATFCSRCGAKVEETAGS
jgi:hypothetical protein